LSLYPVILDPDVRAQPLVDHVAELLERQLPADVLVELAVVVVSGVARLRAPHLPRGLEVASEEDHTAGGHDRREHAVAGPGVGVGEPVRREEAEAQAGLAEAVRLSGEVT